MPRYEERESNVDERTRGEVLKTLAEGAYWAFLLLEINPDGTLSLKIEQDDRLDAETLKAMLNKIMEALP